MVVGLDHNHMHTHTVKTRDRTPSCMIRVCSHVGASVFTNPYQEMEDEEKKAEAAAKRKAEQEASAASDTTTNKVCVALCAGLHGWIVNLYC